MKPWTTGILAMVLAGCAHEGAPRVRCSGPWRELPRVTGVPDPAMKTLAQPRESTEASGAQGSALVEGVDPKPREARPFSEDAMGAETMEVSRGQ